MDIRSVTRPAPPSTRSVLAGAHLCDQVAGLLLVEPKTTRQVFLGEPVEEVLAMVKWALKHEGEASFNPERILPAWAKKRGRGYWRTQDCRVEECGCCHGTSVSHLKGPAQSMILPPATSSVTPVSQEELSEARNRVASATSSGFPIRPSGNMVAHCCC